MLAKSILWLTPIFLTSLMLPVCTPTAISSSAIKLETLELPAGFKIEVYAEDIQNARSMCLSPNGTVFVGTRSKGNVYALRDEDGDNVAEKKYTLATGMRMPNGVAFRDGALYVAEVNRVLRYDGIESKLENPPQPVVVNDGFPDERAHGWKYIAFGPDEKLYVPVGAPGNIVERTDDERFASIMRMDADGQNLEVFVHGVRNSVGFDWDPATGDLWFTDNGRDWLGDDAPTDELNHAPRKGMHFGYPYCHQGDILDTDIEHTRTCDEFEPPAIKLGPHVAALGMTFYTGEMFPKKYRGNVFICEHGSWNRSDPIGYRVSMVTMKDGKADKYEPFLTGFQSGNSAWGRPVDVLQMPDGALLISDDNADAIYRVSYR